MLAYLAGLIPRPGNDDMPILLSVNKRNIHDMVIKRNEGQSNQQLTHEEVRVHYEEVCAAILSEF